MFTKNCWPGSARAYADDMFPRRVTPTTVIELTVLLCPFPAQRLHKTDSTGFTQSQNSFTRRVIGSSRNNYVLYASHTTRNRKVLGDDKVCPEHDRRDERVDKSANKTHPFYLFTYKINPTRFPSFGWLVSQKRG